MDPILCCSDVMAGKMVVPPNRIEVRCADLLRRSFLREKSDYLFMSNATHNNS
jgi:hypothetical protein